MNDQGFDDFGLIKPIKRALREIDYRSPTPVQLQSIPSLLAGRDLLGCAQTGTGKTAAFSLPIIQHLVKNQRKRESGFVRALIVTPTRELAAQIYDNLNIYGKYVDVPSVVIYGGIGQNPQVANLNKGVDILVATPGRLLDLIGQGFIKLEKVEIFVLDEADRMLDMGFIHDIRRILKYLPGKRQTMFFSATLPPDIIKLAKRMVNDPIQVDVTPEKPVVEFIDQRLMFVEKKEKPTVLMNILKDADVRKSLVFTRTKHGANKLVKILLRADIGAQAIHGNKSQTARTKALDDFKEGRISVLVASDLAARGIDVDGISHVFNYEIPNISETYVHRIGRTARAGCRGISISLCQTDERPFIRDIEKLIKQSIPIVSADPFMTPVALKPLPKPTPRSNKSNKNRDHKLRPQESGKTGDRQRRRPRNRGGQHNRKPQGQKPQGQRQPIQQAKKPGSPTMKTKKGRRRHYGGNRRRF